MKRKYWLGLGVLVVLALLVGVWALLRQPPLSVEEQRLVGTWQRVRDPATVTKPNEEEFTRFTRDRLISVWVLDTKSGDMKVVIDESPRLRWSVQNGQLTCESFESFPVSLLPGRGSHKTVTSISYPTTDTVEVTATMGDKIVSRTVSRRVSE